MFTLMLSVPSQTAEQVARLVLQAMRDVEMDVKELAFLMGITRQTLDGMLSGERPLQFTRLFWAGIKPAGKAFWKAFLLRVGAATDVEDLDAIAAQLRIVNGMFSRRMAKADLGNADQERRTA